MWNGTTAFDQSTRALHQQGEYGLFVTLGDYTAQARQFERGKHNLRLINEEELVDLIFEHYEKFEPRYQVLLRMKKVYIPGALAAENTHE